MVDGFNWILPGKLAGSGRPGLLNDLESDLDWLRSAGIRHVVSLTERPLVVEDQVGFELHHFPIPDMGIPTPRAARQLCDFILRAIARNEPVLVHCKAGLGRTGTVLACCLVSTGETAEEAVSRLRRVCAYYIQNQAQESLVRHYAEFLMEELEEDPQQHPFGLAASRRVVRYSRMKLKDVVSLLAPALDEVSNGVTLADARDAAFPLVFVNRAFERVTGYASADALGRNCRFLQGAGTDPRAIEEIRRALSAGEPCHVCLRNYRKDGTAFLNELKLIPVHDTSGEVEYFIGIQNDVTAQLLARALRQREDGVSLAAPAWRIEHLGYSLSLDPPLPRRWGAEIGVLVADHRGRVCYANRVAGKFLGTAPADLIESNVFDHLDADWLSSALRSESQHEHEWLTARICGAESPELRSELSTYRVALDLSQRPFYVILIRDQQDKQ